MQDVPAVELSDGRVAVLDQPTLACPVIVIWCLRGYTVESGRIVGCGICRGDFGGGRSGEVERKRLRQRVGKEVAGESGEGDEEWDSLLHDFCCCFLLSMLSAWLSLRIDEIVEGRLKSKKDLGEPKFISVFEGPGPEADDYRDKLL